VSFFVKLLSCCAFLLVALPFQASALAELDFVSSEGRFALDDNRVDFGNGLNISIALDDSNTADPSIIGFDVVLSDLVLTGTANEINSSGIFEAIIDTSVAYTFKIVNDTGQDVLQATYDPGEFLLIGTGGMISPINEIGLTNVTLLNGGDSSPTLAAFLAADENPLHHIDFNVALSSAGGPDLVTALQDDLRVEGPVAGSLAVVVPEAGTLPLLLGGVAVLAVWRRLRS
jgi:hypothetical protein